MTMEGGARCSSGSALSRDVRVAKRAACSIETSSVTAPDHDIAVADFDSRRVEVLHIRTDQKQRVPESQ